MEYMDIINLQRPISKKHPSMPAEKRAAQFAPFAALTGYDAAIKEKARLVEHRKELSEEEITAIDRQLRYILKYHRSEKTMVTYFCPDERKVGGKYVTVEGRVKKVVESENTLIMTDGQVIPIDNMIGIEIVNRPSE